MTYTEEDCPRIIRTRPGAQTGETVYVTEDGRTWTTHFLPTNTQATGVTGVTTGYVNGDRMCPWPGDE